MRLNQKRFINIVQLNTTIFQTLTVFGRTLCTSPPRRFNTK